jgi:hypothetical protein
MQINTNNSYVLCQLNIFVWTTVIIVSSYFGLIFRRLIATQNNLFVEICFNIQFESQIFHLCESYL